MIDGTLVANTSSSVRLDRDFYTRLRGRAGEMVPMVGAGLAAGAGVPGFAALIAHLVEAAEETRGSPLPMTSTDQFGVVDRLAEELSPLWVARVAAEFIGRQTPTPTPALRALARVPSRLIITTNYDLAIEKAAEAVGQPYVTLTVDDVPVALQPPGDDLRVLHLHGVVSDPGSIVLTKDSYEVIEKDERAQLVMRDLASRFQFVFLGHSLSDREVHLRRDIGWAIANFPATGRQHLLISDQVSISSPESKRFKAEIEQATGVTVGLAEDPDRAFTATLRTAHVLAGEGADVTNDFAPLAGSGVLDPFYVSTPVADFEMISTPGGQGRHMAQVMQSGETYSTDLDLGVPCLLLIAEGGFGKSEELRRIGKRATAPSLLQQLSAFNADRPWTEIGARFVACMNSAQALRESTPRLTLERLRDQSYVFLLDGLDEVPIGRRSDVAQLLAAVAVQYPQHRFVVASRPILGGFRELSAFAKWSPVPDYSWLEEYSECRGVAIQDLYAALPDTGDISELVKIPIYASAAVGRVFAGHELPSTALELVLDLADQRIQSDPRVEGNPGSLKVWLDRLALCMVTSQTTEVDHQGLIESGLAQDLPGLSDGPDLIALVASRALVTEVDGRVRFPANVVREARASRAILQAGESGLQFVREHALVQLPTRHGDGSAVMAVRSGWARVIEQLLPLAPHHWGTVIGQFDSRVVARATPTSAGLATRHAAVYAIWDSYVCDKIWLQSNRTGDGSGDEEALQRLICAGVPAQFVTQLVEATSDAERTIRGNALRLLPFTDVDDARLWPIVAAAITDPDPVVRRFSAIAAHRRTYKDLVPAMIVQAHADDDELAPGTLLDFAMDLATEDEAIDIARAAGPELAGRARGELVRRLKRSRVLDIVRQDDKLDAPLVHTLLEASAGRRSTSWSVEDVVALARIAGAFPDDVRMPDVVRILSQYPGPVLLAWCTQCDGELARQDVHRLGRHLSDEEVNELTDALRDPSTARLTDNGYATDTIDLVDVVRATVVEVLASIKRQRSQVADDDNAELYAVGYDITAPIQGPHLDSSALPEDWREALREATNRSIEDPSRSFSQARIVSILRIAANTHQPLDAEDCRNLATFLLAYDDNDLTQWLHDHWMPEVAQAIYEADALTEHALARIASVLPGPWPGDLADQVLDAIDKADLRLGERLTAAGKVAQASGRDVVRTWAASHEAAWIDPALVHLGDSGAEARLIAKLNEVPASIRCYPDAYDEEWISALRCPTSTLPLAALVKTALIAGVEHSELDGICKALSRCAGLDAPRVWDELVTDEEIPAPGFLIYDKRSAIAELIDREQPPPSYDTLSLQERVRLLVKHPATY